MDNMATWFKRRITESQLEQNTEHNQREMSHNENGSKRTSKRAQSHFIGIENNASQYHYIVTTFIQTESFHIFSSTNLQHVKSAILQTTVSQSAFGQEIENLSWDLYIVNNNNHIKLTTNSQLYAFITKQFTHHQRTTRLQMKLVHDEKYDIWLNERKTNALKSPQLCNIEYTDCSCCIQVDCGWKAPILNAYKLEYQLINNTQNTDTLKIYESPDNTSITIDNIWPSLAYKCRARLVHVIFNTASDWSQWKEIILSVDSVESKEEKKEKAYNFISYFECMDHEQLQQWTQCKLFGNINNPLLVYDDEKDENVCKQLQNKIWTTKIETESGLLSLVQYAISESALNGRDFLLNDPQQYIKQLLPNEIMNAVNTDDDEPILAKHKTIKDGGYGMNDYLSIIWRLRELAYLEGGNMRYSMHIPLYNPYTIFIWMYFLKIPSNEYSLFCKESQSYVLLKHFSSESNNECHLFLGKYYVRKSPKDINISFELHEMIKMDVNMNVASAKPVLLNGNQDVVIIHTNKQQHVISRCYQQKEVITKYKFISDWQNLFVHRFKIHGLNMPYFECMMDGILNKVGKEVALCPAIDALGTMFFWHGQTEKNKVKTLSIIKQKLQQTEESRVKHAITERKDIVQFFFDAWWLIEYIDEGKNHHASNKIIQHLLLGKFGGFDRVFPLLRTIFYGISHKYIQRISTSILRNSHSLAIRMQLLLWLNFLHCISANTDIKKKDNLMMKNANMHNMELSSDLMEMIKIDASFEQITNIQRVFPLEYDAFYVLKVNSAINAQKIVIQNMDIDDKPSKYTQKLCNLLLIFKPNFHFIFDAYFADIISILKQEQNPIQCLEVIHKVLNIQSDQNEASFMLLVDAFIPKISSKSPLFLQKAARKSIQIKSDIIDKRHSNANEEQYALIAMKHRISVLNLEKKGMKEKVLNLDEVLKENQDFKARLLQKQIDLDQYMNTIKLLTKESKDTQITLEQQLISNNAMIQTINVLSDKQKTSDKQCNKTQNEIKRKDDEIKQLKQQIQTLQNQKQNVLNTRTQKRYRPLLLNSDEIQEKCVINVDSDALKVELLNYIKYQKQLKTSKKYASLMSFHDIKAQIISNWNAFKSQFYDDLIETLLDIIDEEQIAYNIGYNLIINCYTFMKKQQHAYNPMVFHTIYLNLSLFYRLKMNQKIPEMLQNVYIYLEEIISAICDYDLNKMMNNEKKLERVVLIFIMECCKVLFSLIHYGYIIAPNTIHDTQHINNAFDDEIHRKENCGYGSVDCLVFPALCKINTRCYATKIWVYCKDQ